VPIIFNDATSETPHAPHHALVCVDVALECVHQVKSAGVGCAVSRFTSRTASTALGA
jgi:hypothetical protein